MCGICGVIEPAGGGPDRALLACMTQVLHHRGPDSSGVHLDGPAGLGATRLAILDLEQGDQPITARDGALCIVHNGEILNHAALREELRRDGHRFHTSGDTEVVLRMYEAHGLAFVEHLRGMFATAIWDGQRRRLVLVRDRFGIKPLFYRRDGAAISFASELKALALHPRFSRELDRAALHAYLSHNSIPAPLTIYRDARKLAPGHMLVWQERDVEITRYARPAPSRSGDLRREPAPELARELRGRLRDSVRAHLVSDVPVGVLLSGGVDSAALTALAAQESREPPATFSIGFEEQDFNELDHARLVAERYGTRHHELVLRPSAAELLPAMVRAFDEPFGDSSALPTYLVARLAAEHVKVVLCGEGGDELFGGYETYAADLLAERGLGALRVLSPLVARLPSTDGRVSLEYRAKRFLKSAHLPPLERHHGWKEIFDAPARARLLTPPWRDDADPLASQRVRFAETAGAPLLARLQDVDLGIYLVDDLLVKTDRMTMAHSVEARVPFLDPAVADLALALPTALKVRGLDKKRLLRQAVSPWVPEPILRARKRGFSIPAAAWLRNELEPFAREVLSPSTLRRHGLLEPAVVGELLDTHRRRERDNSRQLWGLMALTLWREAAGDVPEGDRRSPAMSA